MIDVTYKIITNAPELVNLLFELFGTEDKKCKCKENNCCCKKVEQDWDSEDNYPEAEIFKA